MVAAPAVHFCQGCGGEGRIRSGDLNENGRNFVYLCLTNRLIVLTFDVFVFWSVTDRNCCVKTRRFEIAFGSNPSDKESVS